MPTAHPAKPSVATLYLSATEMVRLIQRKGLRECLSGMADYIGADFLRWQDFDKTPRVANHSADGVIELMPISDPQFYSFKYVNGHHFAAAGDERALKHLLNQKGRNESTLVSKMLLFMLYL